nr:ribosomal protein S3 [Erodium stephanianum]
MGQKINPLGFRLGTTQNHHSIWFEQPKNYCEGLQEDKKIRDCIKNYIDNHRDSPLKDFISRIQIEKGTDGVKVIIYMGFLAFLKEGKTPKSKKLREKHIKELKVNVEKVLRPYCGNVNFINKVNAEKLLHFGNRKLQKVNVEKLFPKLFHCGNRKLNIAIREIGNPYRDPKLLAEYLANQLKTRVSFRKAMKQTIQKAEKAYAKGIKVQIAGRIEGKEIASVEWLRKGRVSLQTIRTKIDFCSTTVRTIHGVLGIKIWVQIGNPIGNPKN